MKNKKFLKAIATITIGAVASVGCFTVAACSSCDDEHAHSYTLYEQAGADGHYEKCECGEKGELKEHIYDDANDKDCNACGYEREIGGEDNPGGGEDNPGGGEDNPGGGEDNPGGGEDNPGGGEDNPGGGEDNPGGGEDNPGGGEDNPGGGEDNPGGGEDNPGGGEDNPGGGETQTLYQQLVAKANKLYNNEFATDGAVGVHNGYGVAGVYADKADHVAIANGAVSHVADKKANSSIIVDFGALASGSELEGYFEVKVSATGSAWNLVQFKDSANQTVLVIGAGTDKTKLAYVVGAGLTEKPDGKTSVNVANINVTDIAFAENTVYKIYYKFNQETGAVTLKINDTDVTIADADIKGVNGIYVTSGNSGARLATIDNLVFCGTEMAAADYAPSVLAKLDAEYAKYILEDGEGVTATHKINAALITAAYESGKTAIGAADSISGVNAAYDAAVAAMKAVLSDAQVATARTAAIAAVDEKLPAAKYTYDFADDNADKIYNNKATYETEIAAIKALINEATTQSALDEIVANAAISVKDNDGQLADKKTAAKTALAAYKADEIEGIKADHEIQYNNISNIKTTAAGNIDGANAVDAVSELLADAQSDIDKQLKATEQTIEEAIADYKADLDKAGAKAKEGVEDQAKIGAVDAAVTAGKATLDTATFETIVNLYNAAEAKVYAAIPKIDAKAALNKAATDAVIHGESDAAKTAKNTIDKAVDDGIKAIDAAADKDAVGAELGKATDAINAAITTLESAEFNVTVYKGETAISTGLKVTYGGKIVIDESKLTLTELEIVKGYYSKDTLAEADILDADAVYYDNVSVYAKVVEAVVQNVVNTFSWAAIDSTTADNAVITEFAGVNAFIKPIGDSVSYRSSTDSSKNGVTGGVIQLKANQTAFSVEFKGTGTFSVNVHGDKDQNTTSFYLQDSKGNKIVATTVPDSKDKGSPTVTVDNAVYTMKSGAYNTFTFTIEESGTYTFGVATGVCRVSAVVVNDNYKEEAIQVTGVELDKTTANLTVNSELQLVAKVNPEETNCVKKVEWSVNEDGKTFAQVDKNGKVTALAAGTAIITVTVTDHKDKTYTANCTLTIENQGATGVQIAETEYVGVGQTIKLNATVLPENASNKEVTWAVTSGDDVASVDANGVVTGIKTGTATITVTTVDGGHTASCTVTVQALPEYTGTVLTSQTLDASKATAKKYGTNVTQLHTDFPESAFITALTAGGKDTEIKSGFLDFYTNKSKSDGSAEGATLTITTTVANSQLTIVYNGTSGKRYFILKKGEEYIGDGKVTNTDAILAGVKLYDTNKTDLKGVYEGVAYSDKTITITLPEIGNYQILFFALDGTSKEHKITSISLVANEAVENKGITSVIAKAAADCTVDSSLADVVSEVTLNLEGGAVATLTEGYTVLLKNGDALVEGKNEIVVIYGADKTLADANRYNSAVIEVTIPAAVTE